MYYNALFSGPLLFLFMVTVQVSICIYETLCLLLKISCHAVTTYFCEKEILVNTLPLLWLEYDIVSFGKGVKSVQITYASLAHSLTHSLN
jgi:hypothetical protein